MTILSNLFFSVLDIFILCLILIILTLITYLSLKHVSKSKFFKDILVNGLIGSVLASILTYFTVSYIENFQIKKTLSKEYVVCLGSEIEPYKLFGYAKVKFSLFSNDLKFFGTNAENQEILVGQGILISSRYLLATYTSNSGPLNRRLGTFAYEIGPAGDVFEGVYSFIDHDTNTFKNGKAKWIKKTSGQNTTCK